MIDDVLETIRETHPQLFQVLLFLIRFNILAIPLYLLLWIDFDPVWLREINAQMTGLLIDLAGIDVTQSGTIVQTPHLTMDVSVDSTGWKSYFALTALIIAVTNVSWRERVIGIGIGLLVVAVGNLTRLVTMIYLVEVAGISYDLVHDLLWRWGLTLLIFGYWAFWLTYGERIAAAIPQPR